MRPAALVLFVALTMAAGSAAVAPPVGGSVSGDVAQPPTGCVATPQAPSCTFACTAGVPFVLAAKSVGSGAGGLAFQCGSHGGACNWGASDLAVLEFCGTYSVNEDDATGLCEAIGAAVAFCGA